MMQEAKLAQIKQFAMIGVKQDNKIASETLELIREIEWHRRNQALIRKMFYSMKEHELHELVAYINADDSQVSESGHLGTDADPTT